MASIAFDVQLSDDARDAILASVRAGGYLATACRAAGVSYQALKYWRRRFVLKPRAVPRRIAGFLAEVDVIHAEIECRLVATIREGGRGWRGAAWELERRFPSRWGKDARRREAEIEGPPRTC